MLHIDVFLSAGHPATKAHRDFVLEIKKFFEASGFRLHTVSGVAGSPVLAIKQGMWRCAGTVVIALERLHALTATEHRGAEEEETITDLKLPTVWTQVETAFAFCLGHPLLIVAQGGLRREGLLSAGHGWPVAELSLSNPEIYEDAFLEAFKGWATLVRANHVAGVGRSRSDDCSWQFPQALPLSGEQNA